MLPSTRNNATTSSFTSLLNCAGCAFILMLVFDINAPAQTFRGGIQGVISDPNGAVIGGADVTVTNSDTGLTRTTQTDEAGSYLVSELPIRNYLVTARKSG